MMRSHQWHTLPRCGNHNFASRLQCNKPRHPSSDPTLFVPHTGPGAPPPLLFELPGLPRCSAPKQEEAAFDTRTFDAGAYGAADPYGGVEAYGGADVYGGARARPTSLDLNGA